MITNLHIIKPDTIQIGTNRKGRRIAFINFNPQQLSDEERQNGFEWKASGNRYVLDDFSVKSLMSVMEPDLLLEASEEEIVAVISAFNEQDMVDTWKLVRKAQIMAYDSSSSVNLFFLNGEGMWLDKATRVGLTNSIQVEKNFGRKITTLWYNYGQFQLPVDTALGLLAQLEIYALDCYNVTAKHLADIETLEDLETLKGYDITAGYPQQLNLKNVE